MTMKSSVSRKLTAILGGVPLVVGAACAQTQNSQIVEPIGARGAPAGETVVIDYPSLYKVPLFED